METLRKYILYFLVGIAICLVGASGVFAETITDMTFSQFRTTISTYGITSNQYVYDTTSAVPVQMDASANGFSWEWITNYSTNCSGQTVISGQLAIPNDNLNYDWLDDNIKTIYYVPFVGYTGSSTPCTWSVNASNNIVSFTCSTPEPHNNFIIGGTLQYRSNSNFNSYFRIYRTFNITCDNSASAIIDNQTQNTQNIINNNNQNTQAIIDSNKQNFESCSDISLPTIEQGSLLGSTGLPNISDYRTRTANYINVQKNTTYTLSMNSNLQSFVFYYDSSNNFIERVPTNWTNNYVFTTTDNVSKIKIVFSKINGETITPSETTDIHLYACINRLDEQTNAINNLDDTLNDDDTSGATSEASDFFSDFDTNTFGLTSIITAPLNLIQSLTSSTCNDLELPLPYLNNKKLILPCMTTIYSTHFGSFFTLYQTITYGIIAYWVCVRIFNMVKDFKNPEHDEIEVLDL